MARRRWRLDAAAPVLLTRVDHQREVIAARCARAARAGVTIGMTLTHARALLPPEGSPGAPRAEALDGPANLRALRRLGARATRLLPVAQPDPPDGLLLDARGCERLYGEPAAIVALVRAWADRLGVCARIASAPTFGGAWALARFGDPRRGDVSVGAAGLREALAPLPIAALRADPEAVERLREVGVERIGELLRLARGSVADRCGVGVLNALDRALGALPEVIEATRVAEPLAAEIALDGPTDRVEAIERCAQEALATLMERLRAREGGCRRIVIRLDRSDMPPLRIEARVTAPTRDAKRWWALLRDKVAGAHLGFGVEGVRIWAGGVTLLPHEQTEAGARDAARCDDAAAGRLADTLIARLGAGRALRPALVESHIPERAWKASPWDEGVPMGTDAPSGGAPWTHADRPLALCEAPAPVRVTLLAPEGPILLVGEGGAAARVIACEGPERIEGEWWRGERSARDYYALTLEDGRRLWVFRLEPGDGWFLHGEWA